MPAGHQSDEREAHDLGLSQDRLIQRFFELSKVLWVRYGVGFCWLGGQIYLNETNRLGVHSMHDTRAFAASRARARNLFK
jgi:hypothetical protein